MNKFDNKPIELKSGAYDVMSLYPKPFDVKVKIGVTVDCVNDKGKFDQVYIETDNLLGATRFINTFKPKRGYRAVEFHIQEVGVLV